MEVSSDRSGKLFQEDWNAPIVRYTTTKYQGSVQVPNTQIYHLSNQLKNLIKWFNKSQSHFGHKLNKHYAKSYFYQTSCVFAVLWRSHGCSQYNHSFNSLHKNHQKTSPIVTLQSPIWKDLDRPINNELWNLTSWKNKINYTLFSLRLKSSITGCMCVAYLRTPGTRIHYLKKASQRR